MLLKECKSKEIVLLDFFVKLYITFKKKAQPKSCKLSFIWGKMRTVS